MTALLVEFREWTMWLMEAGILIVVTMEYLYDKEKDDRKQRRTRTTKKTTTAPGGVSTAEETTETFEPIEEKGENK